eukprot:TRINITY_DN49239_c0_g1_i1.p1 TRINITY_DN49239_c0_g1~~TRINITY_DN49239_c0_g1_i1.p1  ORF type:complete len:111 (-),score=15.44 TRINITY_DN49239_c0_g1_i1:53-385(-)
MIGEWVQLHKDIQWCCKVITSLKQNMATTERLGTGQSTAQQYSNTLLYERQLELVSTVLNDVDTLCHRVKHHCFSDVDRVVYNLSLIHISEPTRLLSISYAVFCLKKKNK